MNFEEKKKRVDKAKAELDEYVQRVNRLLDDLFRVENDVNVKEWWMLKSGEAIQVAGSVAGVVTEICTVHLSVHDIEVIKIRFSNCVLRYEKRFFLSMFKKVDWDATPESIENKKE